MSVVSLMVSNVGFPLVKASVPVNSNPQSSQISQLSFNPPVSLSEVNAFLNNKAQFRDFKGASVIANIQVGEWNAPVTLDFNFDLNKTVEQFTNNKKSLTEGLKKAKNEPVPTQRKFDRTKLVESFSKPIDSSKPMIPIEEELQYYEINGVLPPIQVNEPEVRAKAKEIGMTNYTIPHIDPKQKGKFTNARIEDRLASMTPEDKQQNDQRVQEAKTQSDLVQCLKSSNLDLTKDSDSVPINQLTYTTSNKDQSANNLSTKANKSAKNGSNLTKQEQQEITDKSKPQKKIKSPECKTKLEDCIESAIVQDTTGSLQADPEQQAKIKADNEEIKQGIKNHLNKFKSGEYKDKDNQPVKAQFSEQEAQAYMKEGINIKDYGAEIISGTKNDLQSNSTQEIKKVSWLEDLLNLGNIKTEAKGLNNSVFPLLIYANQNTNLSFQADTPNWAQQIKLSWTNGNFTNQRWCFDNDTNQIYLSYNQGTCTGRWNKMCLHALQGAQYGSQVVLINCNWNNYQDAWQQWVFDENGRIAIKSRPDMCMENASGLTNGNPMVMWGCHDGANGQYRAGDNNFGTSMGMTMWAVNNSYNGYFLGCFGQCSNLYNAVGHAFVELWNNSGTRNTFSRWGNNDVDCNNNMTLTNNNICDYDAITVDTEIEIKDNYIRNTKYAAFRRYGIYMYKSDWDKLVFGSGFRDNYKNGVNVDIGGKGTYYYDYQCVPNGCWIANTYSMSRNSYYNAAYTLSLPNSGSFRDICSSYSAKLWNAYSGSSINFGTFSTPSDIYNQI